MSYPPTSKEYIRIWCDQHDRAPESWDKWPRLMPRVVAIADDHMADMTDFYKDGTWAVNLKKMSCGDNGWLCMDDWHVSMSDVSVSDVAMVVTA